MRDLRSQLARLKQPAGALVVGLVEEVTEVPERLERQLGHDHGRRDLEALASGLLGLLNDAPDLSIS